MVVGGGPLGTELGQAFRRLGAAVVLVHDEAKFLPREERDAAQPLSDSLARDGVEIHLDTRAVDARRAPDGVHVGLVAGGRPRQEIVVDAVLAGIGRTADVESLALERADIDFAPGSGIRTDDRLRTTNPRVWAADGEEPCFVKIHVRAGTGRIVGATIVARHAGEMINEITLAMQRGIGLAALSRVIHCYPTQAMAIKLAADRCAAERAGPALRGAARRWLEWRRRG